MVYFGNPVNILQYLITNGGNNMSNIEYERTIEINYKHDDEMNKDQKSRFAHELQKRGITLRSRYGTKPVYGFNEVTNESSEYEVLLNGEPIFTTTKNYVAYEARDRMNDVSQQTAEVERTEIVKTRKEWRRLEGNFIQLESLEDDYISGKHCINGESIYVEASIYQFYSSMQLEIKTSWKTDKIQREDVIKETLVESPLKVVGDIQRIFESVLKLKKVGYDVNDVDIDCNFKAMTANESKCSPDIIKMTREARR